MKFNKKKSVSFRSSVWKDQEEKLWSSPAVYLVILPLTFVLGIGVTWFFNFVLRLVGVNLG